MIRRGGLVEQQEPGRGHGGDDGHRRGAGDAPLVDAHRAAATLRQHHPGQGDDGQLCGPQGRVSGPAAPAASAPAASAMVTMVRCGPGGVTSHGRAAVVLSGEHHQRAGEQREQRAGPGARGGQGRAARAAEQAHQAGGGGEHRGTAPRPRSVRTAAASAASTASAASAANTPRPRVSEGPCSGSGRCELRRRRMGRGGVPRQQDSQQPGQQGRENLDAHGGADRVGVEPGRGGERPTPTGGWPRFVGGAAAATARRVPALTA